jgi:hypothetical protein
MNIALLGLERAADQFLQAYEAETGRRTENLAFWELAAAIRPMVDPAEWCLADSTSPDAARLQRFIANAQSRAGE